MPPTVRVKALAGPHHEEIMRIAAAFANKESNCLQLVPSDLVKEIESTLSAAIGPNHCVRITCHTTCPGIGNVFPVLLINSEVALLEAISGSIANYPGFDVGTAVFTLLISVIPKGVRNQTEVSYVFRNPADPPPVQKAPEPAIIDEWESLFD